MAKKKFTQHFYCSSYIDLIPISKAPEDKMIPCKLAGTITKQMMEYLSKQMGAVYDAETKRELEEAKFFFRVDCYIPKMRIKEASAYLKSQKTSMLTDSYVYLERSIPGGYLFAGWKRNRPTKIKPEDLPAWYIHTNNYKKCGYLDTANVCDIAYKWSPFHEHTFKDDFLYLSYTKQLEKKDGLELFEECDEYIFGNDIVQVLAGIEKYNPDNPTLQEKISVIKQQMVEQYNAYVEKMKSEKWQQSNMLKKISSFEELLP